jgi:hypothetical protein
MPILPKLLRKPEMENGAIQPEKYIYNQKNKNKNLNVSSDGPSSITGSKRCLK